MTSAGEQLRLDGQDAALAAATVGHHDHPNHIETRGHIAQTGWCQPARKERHSNPNRVWKGAA
ncbi:hypothetical protein HG717_16480 [Rhodococcus erythropolis]|uniref:hypothetical protein n=1 Tax=Rhodococcus erythropolis TaxID=1833 RepID=UPI001C9B9816|nr:hypothetical protein [Rhodococcus erythropolis]MBY6385496.1 hypothetical protein [Rhodococcus erythropolis]